MRPLKPEHTSQCVKIYQRKQTAAAYTNSSSRQVAAIRRSITPPDCTIKSIGTTQRRCSRRSRPAVAMLQLAPDHLHALDRRRPITGERRDVIAVALATIDHDQEAG